MICNVCLSSEIDHVISLPEYPLNSIYLTQAELNNLNRFKPRDLSLYVCKACGHFQAQSGVALTELYNDDYNYNTQNSGVQGRLVFFLKQLEQISNIKFNRIIDIGCYDLSLLKEVKKQIASNYYIGIDPSIPSKCLVNNDDIICFKDYVDNVNIPYFKNDLPDLIISDQTFEHIPTINSTLETIISKVSDKSIFAVCVPSMEVLIEKLNFHNLIHEHVNYFSVNSLSRLFQTHNWFLRSYTLNYISTCGFLFGLFSKTDKNSEGPLFKANGLSKGFFIEHYSLFKSSLEKAMEIIHEYRDEKFYGFGASDITANLAYFMNSDFSFLINIFDDTEYKKGKYFPYLKPEIISQNGYTDLSDSNCFITSPQASRYIYTRIKDFSFKRIVNPIGIVS